MTVDWRHKYAGESQESDREVSRHCPRQHRDAEKVLVEVNGGNGKRPSLLKLETLLDSTTKDRRMRESVEGSLDIGSEDIS
nr:hypothetical protein CFP56_71761 [Quercus suber]